MRGFVKYIIPRIYYERVRKLGVIACLALVAAGCGNGGSTTTTTARNSALDESAARFVVRVQAQLRRAQFPAAWQTLHPAEQRVVSATRLASCYPRNYYPHTVTFRATQVKDVSWRVPGTSGLANAEAVTVTAHAGGKTIDTFDQHIVRRNHAWRWVLSQAFFDKAKTGAC
jgi:hypothetical protein